MPQILPSQEFLEIDQIKQGVVVLKNQSLRAVLMISSLNFALKSEEEQNAIIYAFQGFLNTLDFALQIIVQSRKLNIGDYFKKLEKLEKDQKNELLKIQTAEYLNFVKGLVESEEIMKKNFYVVIPYSPSEGLTVRQTTEFLKKPKLKTAPLTEEQFGRSKIQLQQRVEFVILGLKKCGLRAIPLITTELAELFWSWHHIEEAERKPIIKIPPELNQ